MFVSGRKWLSGIKECSLPFPAVLWIVGVCERKPWWKKTPIEYATKHCEKKTMWKFSQVKQHGVNRLLQHTKGTEKKTRTTSIEFGHPSSNNKN